MLVVLRTSVWNMKEAFYTLAIRRYKRGASRSVGGFTSLVAISVAPGHAKHACPITSQSLLTRLTPVHNGHPCRQLYPKLHARLTLRRHSRCDPVADIGETFACFRPTQTKITRNRRTAFS